MIEELPWSEFWPQFVADYGRGSRDDAQHVTIIGPAGTGKTTLAMQVAALRRYVIALLCKPRDEHMRRMLRQQGYRRSLVIPEPQIGARVAVWPPFRDTRDLARQTEVFRSAMNDGFRAGVWHLLADEGHYLVERCRLGPEVKSWLQQGRSNGNGMILCVQRPAWMPRDIYSSATHIFMFGTNDSADLKSIGGLNGMNDKLVRETVAGLGRDHRFLYVNTATGKLALSRYQP